MIRHGGMTQADMGARIRETEVDDWSRVTLDHFHQLWYSRRYTWEATGWMGYPSMKNPMDLWVAQELICELQPELIIETGSGLGGTALFYADLLNIMGKGAVITIDIKPAEGFPVHPRLRQLIGSSVSKKVLALLKTACAGVKGAVMVFLDSDHRYDHVLKEMRAYGPLVTPGSCMVVEDTNLTGHPVQTPKMSKGPWEAVDQFLAENPQWSRNKLCERMHFTFNPGGYLFRKA